MSENIQSIANGSFVLGQTSATNFVAGPGIKIDEPSAGTVRIGNDETVLYSGAGVYNTDIQLTESLSGFDYLRVDYALSLNNTESKYSYNSVSRIIPTNNLMTCKQLYINDMFPNGTGVGQIVIRNVGYTVNNDGTKLNYMNSYQVFFNGSTWTTGSTNMPIYKIIGINRINA